jgi:anti-anti-sigma factor
MSARIQVVSTAQAGSIVAAVDGEVDLLTVDHLETELMTFADGRTSGLIVDLTATTFFSVAGMRILRQVQHAMPTGTRFAIAAAEMIARPMRLIGMDSEMAIYASVDQAVNSRLCPGVNRAAS